MSGNIQIGHLTPFFYQVSYSVPDLDVPDFETHVSYLTRQGFEVIQEATGAVPAAVGEGVFNVCFIDTQPAGLPIIAIGAIRPSPNQAR